MDGSSGNSQSRLPGTYSRGALAAIECVELFYWYLMEMYVQKKILQTLSLALPETVMLMLLGKPCLCIGISLGKIA